MASIPKTSTTLLKQISGTAKHPRWVEFVARYRPMMEAFMQAHFPGLEADDVIQETLLGVVKVLPGYVERPDRKGTFHNFLTGVLRHKAIDVLRKTGRRGEAEAQVACGGAAGGDASEEEWRQTVYAVALGELMDNPRLGARSKQIFLRTALRGEKPQAVADSLGVARGVVDLTKARMTARLRKLVDRLKDVDGL